jgi:hypothetical protein
MLGALHAPPFACWTFNTSPLLLLARCFCAVERNNRS